MKDFKSKKTLIIIAIIIIGIISGCLLMTKTTNGKLFSSEPKVKITKNETSKLEYEDYNNGLVSLKIPKGWKVEVAPTDYIHYTFKAYNPENKNYMFIFNLKQEGFLKTEKARSTYAKYYPDAVFSKLSPIDPQTTEAFYKVWNSNAKLANEIDFKSEFFPYFNDFNIIENLGNSMLGGDILRATFTNNEGVKNQGLFTSSVKSIGTYYINTDIWNLFSEKVDVSPLNVYNIIIMSTPDEEFNNWQPILDHCLSTIEFSEKFINGFNSEEQTLVSTIKANQKIYDQISDSIMSSWEARNNSYDIISQKQSDATLGYERVYDTDTNEIYKAQNGFMDHYDGTKYKPITDDMYNLPTAGYIE